MRARAPETAGYRGAARLFEPRAHLLALDHVERRHPRDVEAFGQIRALLAIDAVELEGLVVLAPLQDLGKESLDAPAAPDSLE